MTGFRFHGSRHTTATLAAASGTSPYGSHRARLSAAALQYQHVIDG